MIKFITAIALTTVSLGCADPVMESVRFEERVKEIAKEVLWDDLEASVVDLRRLINVRIAQSFSQTQEVKKLCARLLNLRGLKTPQEFKDYNLLYVEKWRGEEFVVICRVDNLEIDQGMYSLGELKQTLINEAVK